jgi:hypothetical protein
LKIRVSMVRFRPRPPNILKSPSLGGLLYEAVMRD